MTPLPTEKPCIAPIQFFSLETCDGGPQGLEIEGGTAFFLQRRGRYLVTALHVWEGFLELSKTSSGRSHGAFVCADGLMPLPKSVSVIAHDAALDIVVLQPEWLSDEIACIDFFTAECSAVKAGLKVLSWGYPGAARRRTEANIECRPQRIAGVATEPLDGRFSFQVAPGDNLGGLSGAPVFCSDLHLVGLVSEANSSFGIVSCREVLAIIERLT